MNDHPSSKACTTCGTPLSGDSSCVRCVFQSVLDNSSVDESDDEWTKLESDESEARIIANQYQILNVIGTGGMGVVYRAKQLNLQRIVALKMLRGGEYASEGARKRFEQEAKTAGKLRHPNIVSIIDWGEHQGLPFYTMEYVEGHTLEDATRDLPLASKVAAKYVKAVAEAIAYAHSNQVLHRDLKPSNVLIDSDDIPRVTDFGLARALSNDRQFTITGQTLGSPSYLPPEQVSVKVGSLGAWSDCYGLGALLYHLLTGRPPITASTIGDTLRSVLEVDPIPPSKLNSSVPMDLEAICLKCLEKNPSRRYQSADEVAEDLQRYLDGIPTLARPVGPAGRLLRWGQRNPTIASLAFGIATALLIGMTATTWAWRRAEGNRQLAERNAAETYSQAYAADIGLAMMAARSRDYGNAKVILARHVSPSNYLDQRGFEWHYLERLVQGQQSTILTGHTNRTTGVAFSLDGSQLASVALDGQIRLYSVADWKLKTNWTAHSGGAFSVSFSHDSKRIATVGTDNFLKVWTMDGNLIYSNIITNIIAATFSPFHDLLAVSSNLDEWGNSDGQLTLLRGSTGDQLDVQAGGRIAFSHFNEMIAHLLPDSRMVIGELTEGGSLKSARTINRPHGVVNAAFNDQNTELTLLTHDGGLVRYDLTKWRGTFEKMAARQTRGLAIRGEHVAFGDSNGNIIFSNDAQTNRLHGHAGPIRNLCYHPTSNLLASVGDDGTVRIWRAEPEETLWSAAKMLEEANPSILPAYVQHEGVKPVLDPEGNRFWFRKPDRSIWVWNPLSTAPAVETDFQGEPIAWCPNQQILLFRDLGENNLWNEGPLRLLTTNSIGIGDVQLTNVSIIIYDKTSLNSARSIREDLSKNSISASSVSRNGLKIAVGFWQSSILAVADAAELKFRYSSFDETHVVQCLAISPDGKYLVSGSREPDLTATVWDTDSLRPIKRLSGHLHRIKSVAFSEDGRTLVTGSFDGNIKVWDCPSWNERITLMGHQTAITILSVSSDSRTVVSVSDDQRVRCWNLAAQRELFSLPVSSDYVQFTSFLKGNSGIIVPGIKAGSLITLMGN